MVFFPTTKSPPITTNWVQKKICELNGKMHSWMTLNSGRPQYWVECETSRSNLCCILAPSGGSYVTQWEGLSLLLIGTSSGVVVITEILKFLDAGKDWERETPFCLSASFLISWDRSPVIVLGLFPSAHRRLELRSAPILRIGFR